LRLYFIIEVVLLIYYDWLSVCNNLFLLMRFIADLELCGLFCQIFILFPIGIKFGTFYIVKLRRRCRQRTINPKGALQVRMRHIRQLCQLLMIHLFRIVSNQLDLVRVLRLVLASFLVDDLTRHVQLIHNVRYILCFNHLLTDLVRVFGSLSIIDFL
jgi:hypothetical protein